MTSRTTPGTRLPDISLSLVGGGTARLDTIATPDNWKLIVIYRGAHCPICASYLKTLQSMLDDFTGDGIEVLAVSADPGPVATEFAEKHGLILPIAYGLDLAQMQALGLYISEPLGSSTADLPFPEPGTFVLNAQGLVHIVAISNAPFVRPDLAALHRSLQYVRLSGDKRHDPFGGDSYPIRGALQG